MSTLFNSKTSELAAILQGDPNIIHYQDNEFGVQIVPGLEQLCQAITQFGWIEGKKIEIEFQKPIKLPAPVEIQNHSASFELYDGEELVTTANLGDFYATPENMRNFVKSIYRLDFNQTNLSEILNWRKVERVPIRLYSNVYASNGLSSIISAVGLSANAMVRGLANDESWFTDLYFPGIRDSGDKGILEEKLKLKMYALFEPLMDFQLMVSKPEPNPENKRGQIVNIVGTSQGKLIYELNMYFILLKKDTLNKILNAA